MRLNILFPIMVSLIKGCFKQLNEGVHIGYFNRRHHNLTWLAVFLLSVSQFATYMVHLSKTNLYKLIKELTYCLSFSGNHWGYCRSTVAAYLDIHHSCRTGEVHEFFLL